MGQHPAAETPQPVHDCCADASCSDHPDGQVAQLLAAHVVQPVIVGVGAADDGFGVAAPPSASASACSRPRCRANRRRSRREMPTLAAYPRRCGCMPMLRVEMYVTPARPSARSVGFVICVLWPTLMHRFPSASSTLASDTAASVMVGATPKRGASSRNKTASSAPASVDGEATGGHVRWAGSCWAVSRPQSRQRGVASTYAVFDTPTICAGS